MHKFKSAVATSREAKNIDFLKQLGNYKDKKLDELTEEELDEVISFINFVGNTLYNGPFKLYRSYDEEETQNIYSTISMKSTPFDTAKTKMVSDIIPLEDFKKNLQELDDIHGFLKNIFSQFDSHVAVLDESTIKTDFDISRCVTVEDLISSSINYLACINKLYNGEHIKFDKYGVLVQEDNMTL